MKKYIYFSPEEFERCNPSCNLDQMEESFLTRLDTARDIAGIPFILNCAFRSSVHDLSKGRSGTSYHTKGRAVDLRCKSPKERIIIVRALLLSGFNGIGIYDTFIHVDDRPIEQQCIWINVK